jgi:hypothetical protein
MYRREFLKLPLLLGLSACGAHAGAGHVRVDIRMPGMALGHRLRDGLPTADPVYERQCEVAILGSGAAGLSAGWRLAKEGFKDFVLLRGPEPFGNAAGRVLGGVPCPSGAHYLPLPSMESTHVREMLADFGVLHGNPFAERPEYDERVLVNAPDERLLIGGVWQDGIVPRRGLEADAQEQFKRFFVEVERLRGLKGVDGRRAFTVPLVLSSNDAVFRVLDSESFAHWLQRNGYTAEAVRWYLDYCCRDDFGAGSDRVSAWAGLHYFVSRGGHAANAEDGTVLTWPDGLQTLTRKLLESTGPQRTVEGMAVRVRERRGGVEVLCHDAARDQNFLLRAKRVIVAMPLHVAIHVIEDMKSFGFDRTRDLPESAAWMVSNVLLQGFPSERDVRQPLAWDNVLYGSQSLGWVVATHQWMRLAKPEWTVFTAYHAFGNMSGAQARRWLAEASQVQMLDLALADLRETYADSLIPHIRQVEITLRGHAMSTPSPGFLNRPGIQALRSLDRAILFAHADMSGFSVFEEAAWWGDQAARKILA